jgi:hypothetical protein
MPMNRPSLAARPPKGASIGGVIGGTVGAVLAAIAAVGTSIAIPGLGIVIAGPVAAALAGAGAGAATGGLIGALVGWGIPEERVTHYEEGIKKGGIVLGVTPRNDEDAAHLEETGRRAEPTCSAEPHAAAGCGGGLITSRM